MPTPVEIDPTCMRGLLEKRLSLSELKSLAFDLGIDDETLSYANKPDLVRELLKRLQQRKRALTEVRDWLGRNDRGDLVADLADCPPAAQPAAVPDAEVGRAGSVFDQKGQTVGTQINVAGDVINVVGDGNVIGNGSSSTVVKGGAGGRESSSVSDSISTAALRDELRRLDDVELDALCMDYFPAVYDSFSRGMRRDEKVNLLLDACRRHPEEAARLARLLEEER